MLLPSSNRSRGASANRLSRRERAVLERLATGASNQKIADQLGISINTVKTHLQRIYSVLGTDNRTEAALLARSILERSKRSPNPEAATRAKPPPDS